MSKEEILGKHNWSSEYPTGGFDPRQEILEAMDEYAKQEAISLLRYWNYECVGYPIEDGDEQMFEETYNDYIQSKNQKP